ncbi:putative secreted protein [Colletotrichum chlorophyti]|uniref:Putative secreted protein n=1 Tax=Colletotrichum chlorophyti TaxID=708187 RepID=A0A1Q8RST9_9PEZI|nr:putative secreted protein [Colletotrichum chlorophyti]
MSTSQARSLFRPVIFIIVVALILTSWNRNGSSRDTMSQDREPTNPGDILTKLSIRIRQSSTSPPTLALSVTNNHDAPLTILRWNSPLDPLALQLGVLSITPEGRDEPLELHTIQLRRMMPPPEEDFVTLQPGERSENEVVLRDSIVPYDELGKTARVAAKGTWRTVWPTTADKLTQETISKFQFGDGALSGEFESEAIDVTIA